MRNEHFNLYTCTITSTDRDRLLCEIRENFFLYRKLLSPLCNIFRTAQTVDHSSTFAKVDFAELIAHLDLHVFDDRADINNVRRHVRESQLLLCLTCDTAAEVYIIDISRVA